MSHVHIRTQHNQTIPNAKLLKHLETAIKQQTFENTVILGALLVFATALLIILVMVEIHSLLARNLILYYFLGLHI